MASQTTTTPKRATRATNKASTKASRSVLKNGKSLTNGNMGAGASRTKATREMTLEELSLRAYKLTYKRLHGSKNKQK